MPGKSRDTVNRGTVNRGFTVLIYYEYYETCQVRSLMMVNYKSAPTEEDTMSTWQQGREYLFTGMGVHLLFDAALGSIVVTMTSCSLIMKTKLKYLR